MEPYKRPEGAVKIWNCSKEQSMKYLLDVYENIFIGSFFSWRIEKLEKSSPLETVMIDPNKTSTKT